MRREKLEQELRGYFRGEVQKKEPPQEWWDKIVLSATVKKPGPYTLGLASKIKVGINIMRGFLTSKQPIWRTALIVLALVLVVGLSVTLPSIVGQDKSAMATESEIMQILISDSRTKALLDDGAIVSFLEEDYMGDKWIGDLIAIVEDETGTTVIAYELDIMFIVQRMLVEIALGDKYYMADVDVNNRKVLSFGEKGDPEFRIIDPRFDVNIRGETLNEEGERLPIGISSLGSRGFEGIESYIDPLYENKIFHPQLNNLPLIPLK